MSVCLIVIPVITGAWPFIAGLATVAAANLGYKVLKSELTAEARQAQAVIPEGVEIPVNEDDILAEGLRPEEALVLAKEDFTVTVKRDGRGNLAIHVDSSTRSKKEVAQEAQRVVHAFRKQFAYVRTVQSLKKKGFTITEEQVDEEGRIRIHLRRFTGGDR